MPKRIGVSDSFGRMHWAPRQDLKSALRQYQKDFSAADRATAVNAL
jgi:hypothetical protein